MSFPVFGQKISVFYYKIIDKSCYLDAFSPTTQSGRSDKILPCEAIRHVFESHVLFFFIFTARKYFKLFFESLDSNIRITFGREAHAQTS